MTHHALIPLLLLLLPLVARAGWSLARRATGDARLSRFLGPGVALGLWVLAIHAFALATRDFHTGLVLGTGTLAALGALSLIWRPPAEATGETRRTPWTMWVGAAAVMALLAGPQLRWQEHDETCYAGHVAIPRQMENGPYPPRYTYFPQFEYRYHYGMDLTTASVSTLFFGADPADTLHVLSLLLWGYLFCLWWLLGERWIGGPGAGAWTAVGAMLTGGIHFGCAARRPFSLALVGDCSYAGASVLPPIISNFMQHPWALAMPIALCALLVFGERGESGRARRAWWYAALFALLTVLALSEIICFALVIGAIAVAGCFEGRKIAPRNAVAMAGLVACVSLAVTHLHGLFTHDAEPTRDYVRLSPLFVRYPFAQWLGWNLSSFGAPLFLGLPGLWRVRRERLIWPLIAGVGLLGANVLLDSTVSHKFAMAAQIALGLGTGAAFTWLWQLPRPKWRALLVPVVGACSIFTASWTFAMAADLPGLWFIRNKTAPPFPADAQAIAFLQKEAKPGENIYRSKYAAGGYAYYGGLPEPFWDYQLDSAHFSPQLLVDRRALLLNPNAAPDDYLAQSFRWLVLGPENDRLLEHADVWVKSGRAELRAEFPPLRIYYLHDSPKG